MYCLQCFSSEDVPNKHKTDCIVINGKQAIRMLIKGETLLNSRIITDSCKHHLSYMLISKKFNLVNQTMMVLKLKRIKNILNAVLVMKCYVVTMISIPNRFNSYRGENAVYKFMEKMLEEVKKCRNTIKYKFNQDNLR